MDEMLEAIVAIVAIVIGIAAKSGAARKKKEAARNSAPKPEPQEFNWDELDDEQNDAEERPVIPYAPSAPQPVLSVQPAMPEKPAPAVQLSIFSALADADSGSMQDPEHPEGCHAEEGGLMGHVKKAPVAVVMNNAAAPSGARRVNAADMRRAVVMSEVLGKPVSMRR